MLERDPLADPGPLIERVYAYVAYRIGDGPHAEDVVGDTFERALRYRSAYDPKKGQPIAWLTGIARRRIAELRGAPGGSGAELPEVEAPGDLEREVAERHELARAVGGLGERDRELIALRYGADLTARQIAEQLGLETNAVEVALHRALGRLRSILDGGQETEEATRPGGV